MTIKRKLLPFLIIVLVLSLTVLGLSACKDDQDDYELKIDRSYIELTVGYKASLSADIIGNAEGLRVDWSSSDKQVATVDSVTGIVEAVSEGIATITATAGDKSAACVVVVKPIKSIAVSNITLNRQFVDMGLASTVVLVADVTPSDATDKTIVWSSLNDYIATVDQNGLVTAVGAGTAVITATAGTKVASCQINVSAGYDIVGNKLRFKTLTVDNDVISGKVSNSTETFNFNEEIEADNDVSYAVYNDVACADEVGGKIVSLNAGENKFYILVKCYGQTKLYAVTINRLDMCTVKFVAEDGSVLETRTVEENTIIDLTKVEHPNDKTGYSYVGWDNGESSYSYEYRVRGDTVFKIKYSPNIYRVTLNPYYGSVESNTAWITFDSAYELEVPTRYGYVFEGWFCGDTQCTDENGASLGVWKYAENGTTLVARWASNERTVTLNVQGCDQDVSKSGAGSYFIGDSVTVSVSATPLGYEFLGWYDGEEKLAENLTCTFAMPARDVTLTAKFKVISDVANLSFTSTDTLFVIRGFKEDADTSDLVIPSYTTDIDEYAFGSFDEEGTIIENVYWRANNLPHEGKPIFVFTKIRNLYFDSSVTYFPSLTFSDNDGVENLYYQGTMSQWCNIDFKDDSPLLSASDVNWYVNGRLITVVVVPTDVTVLKNYVFSGSNITTVVLHDGITEIGDGAFRYCRSLKYINLPSSLISIGAHAFLGNVMLTGQLAIPEGVTQLGNLAFFETRFTRVVIPTSVSALGNNLFDGVTNENETLKEFYFGGTREQWEQITIGNPNRALSKAKMFYYSEEEPSLNDAQTDYDGNYWRYVGNKITVWKISDAVVTVVRNVDGDNISSKAALYELGDEVTLDADCRLGYDFLGWYDGEQLLTDQVTYTFVVSFKQSNYIEKWQTHELAQGLTFESTATEFVVTGAKDVSVEEITIPYYATQIKSYAFAYDYKSLRQVTFLSGVYSIGSAAFARCESLTKVEIDSLDNWLNITFFDVHSNPLYYANDLYINGNKLTDLVIPENFEKIKSYAFVNSSITSVHFHESVTSIGEQAFDGSELSGELIIPDSVTEIGTNAFWGCWNITDLTIGRGVTSVSQFINCHNLVNVTILDGVKAIGSGAFINCWNLQSIQLPSTLKKIGDRAFLQCVSLTNIELPNGLKEIGSDAFRKCLSLQSVVIPSSVETIKEGAFSVLEVNLYYKGTAAQWAQIEIGEIAMTNATVYFYSESEPALNGDETDYDGNYWHYVNGQPVAWTKEDNE